MSRIRNTGLIGTLSSENRKWVSASCDHRDAFGPYVQRRPSQIKWSTWLDVTYYCNTREKLDIDQQIVVRSEYLQ